MRRAQPTEIEGQIGRLSRGGIPQCLASTSQPRGRKAVGDHQPSSMSLLPAYAAIPGWPTQPVNDQMKTTVPGRRSRRRWSSVLVTLMVPKTLVSNCALKVFNAVPQSAHFVMKAKRVSYSKTSHVPIQTLTRMSSILPYKAIAFAMISLILCWLSVTSRCRIAAPACSSKVILFSERAVAMTLSPREYHG